MAQNYPRIPHENLIADEMSIAPPTEGAGHYALARCISLTDKGGIFPHFFSHTTPFPQVRNFLDVFTTFDPQSAPCAISTTWPLSEITWELKQNPVFCQISLRTQWLQVCQSSSSKQRPDGGCITYSTDATILQLMRRDRSQGHTLTILRSKIRVTPWSH